MASFGMGQSQAPSTAANAVEPSTPWMAVSEGNLPLLQSALSVLQLPATAADENGYTLLHAAASYRQLAVMTWLLQTPQSVPVNAVDGDGDTALHHAESLDAIKFLIEQGGADPNVRNAEGKSPLQAKQEELKELMEEDDDDDDVKNLNEIVAYLQGKEQAQ
eukprot:CAMPEP_0195284784 /NCGR_PEP_ID=MMETSP0707-20130614/2870_1 /TAXON_ID=33640 /ORGANISM="Asterionellopsis glacialis, Strain CCMP134" /LENGTH=161 /DNA_ID=CAMNT_0040344181 /DNA_START=117 /DNA_END=602 /DNA_ORIENTATION=+